MIQAEVYVLLEERHRFLLAEKTDIDSRIQSLQAALGIVQAREHRALAMADPNALSKALTALRSSESQAQQMAHRIALLARERDEARAALALAQAGRDSTIERLGDEVKDLRGALEKARLRLELAEAQQQTSGSERQADREPKSGTASAPSVVIRRRESPANGSGVAPGAPVASQALDAHSALLRMQKELEAFRRDRDGVRPPVESP